ncbi:MAG TPA: hypothetical protein VFS11_06945 [Gemmatimonadales bacterium]|nr:hypothetical protein [Gemmatimonadales bacterium]
MRISARPTGATAGAVPGGVADEAMGADVGVAGPWCAVLMGID